MEDGMKRIFCIAIICLFLVPAIAPAPAVWAAEDAYNDPVQRTGATFLRWVYSPFRDVLFGGAASDALARAKNDSDLEKGRVIANAYIIGASSNLVYRTRDTLKNDVAIFNGNPADYQIVAIPEESQFLIKDYFAAPITLLAVALPGAYIGWEAALYGYVSATGASVIYAEVAK